MFGLYVVNSHKMTMHKVYQGLLLLDILISTCLGFNMYIMFGIALARLVLYAYDSFLSYVHLEPLLRDLLLQPNQGKPRVQDSPPVFIKQYNKDLDEFDRLNKMAHTSKKSKFSFMQTP